MGETRKTGPQLADIEVGTVDAEFLDGLAGFLGRVRDACKDAAGRHEDSHAGVYLSALGGECAAAMTWSNMAREELRAGS